MADLFVSTPAKGDESYYKTFQDAGLPQPYALSQKNGWYVCRVELRKKKHYALSNGAGEDPITFMHIGLSLVKKVRHTIIDYKGQTTEILCDDIEFEGLSFTLRNLINSFKYITDPNDRSQENGIIAYPSNACPVIIILFLQAMNNDVSKVINDALGIDSFGKSARKIYVIAIPIIDNLQFKNVESTHFFKLLLKLLATSATIDQILSTIPGAKHFAQLIQWEDEGEDAERKDSLKRALTVFVGNKERFNLKFADDITFRNSRLPNKNPDILFSPKDYHNSIIKDEVFCTIYSPKNVFKNLNFLVQVFAHNSLDTELLESVAKGVDEGTERRVGTTLSEEISRKTKIDFQLIIPGVDIEDPLQSIIWNGKIKFVQFTATVQDNFRPSYVFGKVIVSVDSVPIGQLKFKISVTSFNGDDTKTQKQYSEFKKFENAFISYASKDRKEVLKRVQMLNLVKVQFFHDLLILEPGDRWESQLYRYIDICDVFFLFWSKAASKSEWVKKEILYALRLQKTFEDPFEIIPVIIEGPPPAKPPAELDFLHFNDKMIYFINSPI